MERCVIYARVSSKEQEETGYSLDAQEQLLSSYANNQGFAVSKLFRISESASGKRQRETFTKMIQYMSKHKVNILICEKVDRLTRNFKDALIIDDWLEVDERREVHLVKDSLKLHKGSRSQEKLNWGIRVLFAKNYTDNLSEEVIKGQVAKLQSGQLPYKPHLGYRTIGEKGKKIHVPDPDTAPLMKEMFALYASGNYSIVELTEKMNSMGLRNQNGNKLSKSMVHKHLQNPFYHGEILWKGKTYPGNHEPLISLELYNRVQQKLGRGTASPYYRVHQLRYKAKIHCKECNRLISWEQQKGHSYGSCKHCKAKLGTSTKYLKQEEVDRILVNKIMEVAPKSPRLLEILNQALKEDAAEETELYKAKMSGLEEARRKGDRRLEKAYDDYLDERISADQFDKRKALWEAERKVITSEINRLSNDKSKYYEAGFQVHVLAERTQRIFTSKNVSDEDRRLLLSHAFSKIEWSSSGATVTYTPAFEFLRNWIPRVNASFELANNGSAKGQKVPFDTSHPVLLRR
jgi:site-specific DNA recombinase